MIVDEITISPSFIPRLANGQNSQGVLLTDENLRVTYWNRWMEIHSGISNESVIGRELFDVFPHLSKNRICEEYKRALSGEPITLQQKLYQYFFPTPSKTENNGNKLMQQSTRIVPLINGNCVSGTITFIEDVTEQAFRESELEKQLNELKSFQEITEALLLNSLEQGFQKVVDESARLLKIPNVAILSSNESGWHLIAKSSASELSHNAFSLDENSIINKIFSSKENLFCPDIKKYYNNALTTLFHETQTFVAVPVLVENNVVGVLVAESPLKNAARSHCKNILIRLASLTASALRNSHLYTNTVALNTQPIEIDLQIEGILADEKSPEEQLRKTVKELEDVISALDAFAIVCITDQNGRITNVNDKFCELTKYSREELIGQDHRILNSGYHSKEFMRNLWATIGKGQIWHDEVRNRAKDGSFHWVDTTIVPFLNEHGKSYQYIVIRYDITKRKEAEEKMKEKTQHLQLALESAELGEWQMDFGSGVMEGSTVFKGILGLSSNATKVKEFLRMVHPEDRDDVKEAFAKALATGKDLHIGYRVVWSDNSIHWIATSGRCLFDEKGKRRRMVGVVRDYTYRKRDEDELKAKKQELQLALESAKLGMWKRNSKTGAVEASSLIRTILGFPPDKVIRLEDVESCTHPEDRENISRIRNEAINKGEDYHVEYRVVKDDGSIHWISTDARCVKDEHGIADHYVGVSQDITERKNTEEEFKRLALVAQKTQNVVLLTNAEDRVIWVNESFTKMFGYTFEEVIGKLPGDVLRGPLTDAKTGEEIGRAFKNHQQRSFEIFNYKKDGQGFWVNLAIAPILADDNTLEGYIGIVSDLTERKQFEEELAQARDAALESAKLKSHFLANMSHEIRTPMNGVIGMTELLLETELDEEQRSCAEIVNSSADTLLKLINDILDFSKIESGKLNIENIDFNLQDTVKEVFEMFSEKAKQKNIKLSFDIEQDVSLHLKGDPHRLGQILTNLIGNALKFTQDGHVLLRVISEGRQDDGRTQIRFSLSDTGIGIPDDFQNRIFNPFTQADGSMTRKYGGTGLGLSICKQLVELMEGEIGHESQVGVGTTFRFTIPYQVPEIGSSEKDEDEKQLTDVYEQNGDVPNDRDWSFAEEPKPEKKMKVLVVEDTAANQQVARLMLKRLGCDVDISDNGQSALIATENNDYDIVFMDCQMPVMDGYEATKEIRNREDSQKHLTVIAMTAHALNGDKEKCLAAGMDDYISKPIKQQDLINAIQKWSKTNGNNNGASEMVSVSNTTVDLTSPFAVEIFGRLDDLTAALDAEDISEIIDQFITGAPSQLQSLADAIASQDAQKVVMAAHCLKGSLANLGSNQLSDCCADIESQARKDSLGDVEENLSEIKNNWGKMEQVFLAYKDKLSGQPQYV